MLLSTLVLRCLCPSSPSLAFFSQRCYPPFLPRPHSYMFCPTIALRSCCPPFFSGHFFFDLKTADPSSFSHGCCYSQCFANGQCHLKLFCLSARGLPPAVPALISTLPGAGIRPHLLFNNQSPFVLSTMDNSFFRAFLYTFSSCPGVVLCLHLFSRFRFFSRRSLNLCPTAFLALLWNP